MRFERDRCFKIFNQLRAQDITSVVPYLEKENTSYQGFRFHSIAEF